MDALDNALDILTNYTGMFLPEKFPVCKAAHIELVQLRQALTDWQHDYNALVQDVIQLRAQIIHQEKCDRCDGSMKDEIPVMTCGKCAVDDAQLCISLLVASKRVEEARAIIQEAVNYIPCFEKGKAWLEEIK